MTAELTLVNEPDDFRRFEAMTLEELGQFIIRLSLRMCEDLILMAKLFPLYEAKGGNIRDLKLPPHLAIAVRRMSKKDLLPQLVKPLLTQASKLNTIGLLPIAEQKKLIDENGEEGRVLMVEAKNGTFDTVMMLPSEMNTQQFKQVFGQGFIRNKEEQIGYLRAMTKQPENPVEKVGNIGEVDKLRKGFEVKHRGFLDLATLKRIIRILED